MDYIKAVAKHTLFINSHPCSVSMYLSDIIDPWTSLRISHFTQGVNPTAVKYNHSASKVSNTKVGHLRVRVNDQAKINDR